MAIGVPSIINAIGGAPFNTAPYPHTNYFAQWWEVTADMFGGVPKDAWEHRSDGGMRTPEAEFAGMQYFYSLLFIREMFIFGPARAERNYQERLAQLAQAFPDMIPECIE